MALGPVVLRDGLHVTHGADPRPGTVAAISLEVAAGLDELTLLAWHDLDSTRGLPGRPFLALTPAALPTAARRRPSAPHPALQRRSVALRPGVSAVAGTRQIAGPSIDNRPRDHATCLELAPRCAARLVGAARARRIAEREGSPGRGCHSARGSGLTPAPARRQREQIDGRPWRWFAGRPHGRPAELCASGPDCLS